MTIDDPYKVLGISQDASEAEVKTAYHKAARKYHPDRQSNKEDQKGACENFAMIVEAYEILTDPVKRYDWRSSRTATTTTTTTTTSSQPPVPPPSATSPKRRSVPSSSSSFQTAAPVSPPRHSNTSKRAEFMAKKHRKQQESPRTPVSMHRKRVAHPPPPSATAPHHSPRSSVRVHSPRSSVRVLPKPANSPSPNWRKSHHIKKSRRASVNMAGSVRIGGMPQPPLSVGATTRRSVIGTATMSGMPMPPLSVPIQRRGSSQAAVRSKSRPSVRHPASANATRKVHTHHRSSSMPEPPLYADMDTTSRSMPTSRQRSKLDRSSRTNPRQGVSAVQKPRRTNSVNNPRVKSSKTKKEDFSRSRSPQPPPRNSMFGFKIMKVRDSTEKKKDKEKNKSKKKNKSTEVGNSSGPPRKKEENRSSSTRPNRRRSLPI